MHKALLYALCLISVTPTWGTQIWYNSHPLLRSLPELYVLLLNIFS